MDQSNGTDELSTRDNMQKIQNTENNTPSGTPSILAEPHSC